MHLAREEVGKITVLRPYKRRWIRRSKYARLEIRPMLPESSYTATFTFYGRLPKNFEPDGFVHYAVYQKGFLFRRIRQELRFGRSLGKGEGEFKYGIIPDHMPYVGRRAGFLWKNLEKRRMRNKVPLEKRLEELKKERRIDD